MNIPTIEKYKKHKLITRMYLIGVILLIVQVILGGITRLTGSGLSITSWDVLTGMIPPLTETSWNEEFLKYQSTPQYEIINAYFSLDDFKFIFFWEWFHRFWARMVGIIGLSFIFILWRKKYWDRQVSLEMLSLLSLGLLQGLVGWIMVKSGLTGDAIFVSPTKLALHFLMAMLMIAVMFIFALQHRLKTNLNPVKIYDKNIHSWTIGIFVLTLLQLILGCFMAGTKSAAVASTFPTINGSWIPEKIFFEQGLYHGITLHFLHRGMAYLLFILVVVWTIKMIRKNIFGANNLLAYFPLIFVFLQVVLGILAVLSSSFIAPNSWGEFEWTAQIHQLVAVCFVLCEVALLCLMKRQQLASSE